MTIIKDMIKTNQRNTNIKSTKEDVQLRQNMLRAAIICACNGNEDKIKGISAKLGTINNADFVYIDELIAGSQFTDKKENINQFLNKHLKGFKQAHETYYYALYNL